MCEKKIRKIKRGSQLTRLREARRLERLQRVASSTNVDPRSFPSNQAVNKAAQTRLLLGLAWKTVLLMHKNKIIQQKIIDLQKETTEYVASMMKNAKKQEGCSEEIKIEAIAPPTSPNPNTMCIQK